jgi:hypothetical protein
MKFSPVLVRLVGWPVFGGLLFGVGSLFLDVSARNATLLVATGVGIGLILGILFQVRTNNALPNGTHDAVAGMMYKVIDLLNTNRHGLTFDELFTKLPGNDQTGFDRTLTQALADAQTMVKWIVFSNGAYHITSEGSEADKKWKEMGRVADARIDYLARQKD